MSQALLRALGGTPLSAAPGVRALIGSSNSTPYPWSLPESGIGERGYSTSTAAQRSTAGEASSSGRSSSSISTSTLSSATTQAGAPNWDWQWVLGKKKGRRPAIKRPARHQFYYCNPDYDPYAPAPRKLLSPYAPPSAYNVDDWSSYRRNMPSDPSEWPRYRKEFIQHLKLREVDWREAFQRGLSNEARALRKQRRLGEEAQRQRAWQSFRDQVFFEAAGRQRTVSTAKEAS